MKTLAELIRWRAAQHPDCIALEYEQRSTTYAELDRRANRVANALIQNGVRPGERVCVLDLGHDHFFETIFGIAKAGAVFTPVNWRLAPTEIAYVIEDARARLLFVGPAFAEAVHTIKERLKSPLTIVCYAASHDVWPTYEAWRDSAVDSDPHSEADEQDAVWQLYTSGTTGNPKGVEITHHNLFSGLASGLLTGVKLTPGDRALVCLPLYHIGGAGYAVNLVYSGMTIVIANLFDPAGVLRLIEERQIKQSFLVPTMLNFLLQDPTCGEVDFGSLETIFYGASPMPTELLERAIDRFDCSFIQAYGLTETTGAVCFLSAEDHAGAGARLRSAGRPAFGVDIRVVDSSGDTCPTGEVGEILIRGGSVMKGYWNQPEASREAVVDGWFHSGDAGYFDTDGYLYIHDRIKDMIVSGAENIYPAEVESVLFKHPAVLDAAVVGVPDERWGEAVKAVVQLRPGSAADEADLIEHCRRHIAAYKCPKSVDFAESLPRNPTGKLLKRELRERYWAGYSRRVN